MSRYAQIKDNEIVGVFYDIPTTWGHEVSGFHLMTDAEREAFGFFPVEQPTDVEFNPEREEIIRDEVVLVNGKAKRVFEKRQTLTDEEFEQRRQNRFWREVRTHRDEYLKQTDWTMAADLVEVKGTEWVQKYKDYRQYLRDITSNEKLGIENDYVFDQLLIKRPEEV